MIAMDQSIVSNTARNSLFQWIWWNGVGGVGQWLRTGGRVADNQFDCWVIAYSKCSWARLWTPMAPALNGQFCELSILFWAWHTADVDSAHLNTPRKNVCHKYVCLQHLFWAHFLKSCSPKASCKNSAMLYLKNHTRYRHVLGTISGVPNFIFNVFIQS